MSGQAITVNHESFDAMNIGVPKYCNLVDSPFSSMDKKSLYLRVILNSLCNAKCYFCHKEGKRVIKDLPIDILMKAVSDSASLGFKKVKYTGGEPLLRKDLALITQIIKIIDSDIEISMTTNGILVKEKIDSLLKAGLDRMNVSLHSLNRDNYKKIVGVDALDKVLDGLNYVKKIGMKGVKINMTVSQYNIHELPSVARYAAKNGFEFRIHNLLPSNEEAKNTLVSIKDIKKFLEGCTLKNQKIIKHGKTITRYYGEDYTIDVKGSRVNNKCKGCTYLAKCNEGIYALRLTPEGHLRPCLYRDDLQFNFKQAIKLGNSKLIMFKAYKQVIA